MAEVKLEHISKVYDDNKKSPDKKAANDVPFITVITRRNDEAISSINRISFNHELIKSTTYYGRSKTGTHFQSVR